MGKSVSRIHSKEDNKEYNILPVGQMPTVVFGRVIRQGSKPGMMYWYGDGTIKREPVTNEEKSHAEEKNGYITVPKSTQGACILQKQKDLMQTQHLQTILLEVVILFVLKN